MDPTRRPTAARWAPALALVAAVATMHPAGAQIIDPTTTTSLVQTTSTTARPATTTTAAAATTAPPATAAVTTTTRRRTTTTASTVPPTLPPPPSTVAPPASTTPQQELPVFKDQGDQGSRALAASVFKMLGGFAVLALLWSFMSAVRHSGRPRRAGP